MKFILGLSLCVALLHADTMQNNSMDYEDAEKAATQLLKTLGKNMKHHLKSEGVIGAAKFCNSSAYELTEGVNKTLANRYTVKRISLKYRSEANKPTANEAKVLEALENLKSVNALPKNIVQNDNGVMKYYKPLVIKKGVCLKCHGNIANSKIGTFMKEHYPSDKAVNYKMNDLRGAVVVSIRK